MKHESIYNQTNNEQNCRKHDRKGEKFMVVLLGILLACILFCDNSFSSSGIKPQFGQILERFIRKEGINRSFAFKTQSGNNNTTSIAKPKNSGSKRIAKSGLGIAKSDNKSTESEWKRKSGTNTTIIPFHKSGDKDKSIRLQYAWDISKDSRFLALLLAENGAMTENLKHPKQKGSIGVDHGLCGINDYYHPEILKDPEFYDWKHQMDICYKLYKAGTTFYGIKNVKKTAKLIIWKPIPTL